MIRNTKGAERSTLLGRRAVARAKKETDQKKSVSATKGCSPTRSSSIFSGILKGQ